MTILSLVLVVETATEIPIFRESRRRRLRSGINILIAGKEEARFPAATKEATSLKLSNDSSSAETTTLTLSHSTVGDKIPRQIFLWAVPVLSMVTAFLFFKNLTHGFDALVQILSQDTWRPKTVEEIDLQTQVVTQVVNGPVITSISVLFATLVTTTVSSLHSRQMQIRSSFTEQLDAIRNLQLLSNNLPKQLRDDMQPHLLHITNTLIQDEQGTSQQRHHLHSMDPSISALLLLMQSAIVKHPTNPLFRQVHQHILDLSRQRRQWCIALQTTFPVMHYAALTLLAATICVAFLVATDQSLFIFESLQVRILWCILVGAFTSLAVVCYDLSSPFAGAYQTALADHELFL